MPEGLRRTTHPLRNATADDGPQEQESPAYQSEGVDMRIKRLVAGAGVALVVGAGAAYALWSANATGTSGSKALSAQTITVTASSGAADLYPGFTQGDLFFTMANTNPYPVTFTSMTKRSP